MSYKNKLILILSLCFLFIGHMKINSGDDVITINIAKIIKDTEVEAESIKHEMRMDACDGDECDYCRFVINDKIDEYYKDIFIENSLDDLIIVKYMGDWRGFFEILGFYSPDDNAIFISATDDVELTFHHELYHYLDHLMDYDYDEDEEWEKLNDDDFEYGRSHELKPGFLHRYGMVDIHEDKAMIYETFFTHQNTEIIDKIVIEKRNLLLKRLIEFFPSVAEIPELMDFI